jgi:hypothetical protein
MPLRTGSSIVDASPFSQCGPGPHVSDPTAEGPTAWDLVRLHHQARRVNAARTEGPPPPLPLLLRTRQDDKL